MKEHELTAILRQGWQIASRPFRPGPTPDAKGALIVFVHGVLAAGPVLDPIRSSVAAKHPCETHTLTYAPWTRIDGAAGRVAELVSSRANGRPVVLVGHSLGGIVVRYAAQVLSAPVDLLVTLATPHAGTRIAHRYPGALAKALRPESSLLRRLGTATDVPHVAIVAGRDTTIVPPESAAAPGATVHWVDTGHNALLFHEQTHEIVVNAVGRLATNQRPLE